MTSQLFDRLVDRRRFMGSLMGAAAVAPLARQGRTAPALHAAGEGQEAGAARRSSLGMATATFAVRLTQGADIVKASEARLPATAFFELCERFGTHGAQVGVAQLESRDAEYIKRLRSWLDARGFFVELSVSGSSLEDPAEVERLAQLARDLGASRLRVPLLGGRRYETFETKDAWRAYVARWNKALPAAAPVLERHHLQLGIENHKDYLAAELAGLLTRIGSPALGACIDFGNNLSLLDDPMDVVRTLAPFAVTTHLKDMAVRPIDRGFELSEVPLGTGILPLAEMIATVRRAKPDVHFCLEMITRDPLVIPYKDDRYWVTFEGRDQARIERIERLLATRASATPLPTVSNLSPAEQLAAEDENLRRSVAYATNVLQL